jgi:hypothetical protein
VLAGEVEAPVVLEVAADDRAQGEDRFGAVQSPSRASYVEAVGDQVAACALDDAGRDRPAGCEGLVPSEELHPKDFSERERAGSASSGQRSRARRVVRLR